MAERSQSVYDAWAQEYDRHWDHNLFVAPVCHLALDAYARPLRILDLCCGAGHLARELSKLGHEVSGLDQSGEMIRLARENAPGCAFECGDARDVQFEQLFDVVVSTYDSLNHVLQLDDLEAVFTSTRAALVPGGTFLFDLGAEEGFMTRWQKPHVVVEDELVMIGRGRYEADTRLADYNLTIFTKRGEWARKDVVILQRCHSMEEVHTRLKRAGFSSVEVISAEDAGMTRSLGRTFYKARVQE